MGVAKDLAEQGSWAIKNKATEKMLSQISCNLLIRRPDRGFSHHHCFAVAAFAILPLEKMSVQSTSTILYLCLVSNSMLIIPSSHIKNALAGLRVSTPDPNKEQLGLSNATKTFWEQWRPFHQVAIFRFFFTDYKWKVINSMHFICMHGVFHVYSFQEWGKTVLPDEIWAEYLSPPHFHPQNRMYSRSAVPYLPCSHLYFWDISYPHKTHCTVKSIKKCII